MAKKKQDEMLVFYKKIMLPAWKKECDEWIKLHGLMKVDFYELAKITKGQYDGLLRGVCAQEPLYRMAEVIGKDVRIYVPIIDQLEHEKCRKAINEDVESEVKEAPADIELQLDIPSFEEVETEETINESDELVTKGMLKDYIRDLLISFLEGIV